MILFRAIEIEDECITAKEIESMNENQVRELVAHCDEKQAKFVRGHTIHKYIIDNIFSSIKETKW